MSSNLSWKRLFALPTSESESMVQGRPSMSDTAPPASVTRRLPAPAWRAEIEKTT